MGREIFERWMGSEGLWRLGAKCSLVRLVRLRTRDIVLAFWSGELFFVV